ncbi:PI-PLC X domain-containing protein 3-like [Euwallacea fornicatus]|uniref:PI-PLC X domain-containing protein 3-like n=1 Tax=Euwallacea fornicatus TaxID=995702 RepID=UPI00338D3B84
MTLTGHLLGFLCVSIGALGAPRDARSGGLAGADLAADLKNWMSRLPEDLRKVPINYLAIPGTHDSFTVDVTSSSKVSPDGEDIMRVLEFLTVAREVMANWSRTQAFDVRQQLEAGIRFFDLRLCLNSDDGDLYFCHGLYSTEVRGVFANLSSYLDDHPNEVVILDCQHFYNFTDATHSEVMRMLKDSLGSKLIPYQSNMSSLTLEHLTALKQQVLVVYRDDRQSGQPLLWPSDSFPTPWYNTLNSTYLISKLTEGLGTRSPSSGYISQLVLTPQVSDILEGLLTTLEQKCAVDFQPARIEWIVGQVPGPHGANVIIGDFIDLDDNEFSKAVINLNSKLSSARPSRVGPMGRVKSFIAAFKSYFV